MEWSGGEGKEGKGGEIERRGKLKVLRGGSRKKRRTESKVRLATDNYNRLNCIINEL